MIRRHSYHSTPPQQKKNRTNKKRCKRTPPPCSREPSLCSDGTLLTDTCASTLVVLYFCQVKMLLAFSEEGLQVQSLTLATGATSLRQTPEWKIPVGRPGKNPDPRNEARGATAKPPNPTRTRAQRRVREPGAERNKSLEWKKPGTLAALGSLGCLHTDIETWQLLSQKSVLRGHR